MAHMRRHVVDSALIALTMAGSWVIGIYAGPTFLGIICGVILLVATVHQRYWKQPEEERRRQAWRGTCASCGYDLRGSKQSLICPECGRKFELYARSPGGLAYQPLEEEGSSGIEVR